MAKIGARTHKISAKRTPNGIKIKYRYQSTTVQIMLWLLAFCVSAVFAICPLARHATRYNLSATTIKLETFYKNAPAYIAGDTCRGADDAVNGSSIKSDGSLLNTGTIPALFEAGGSVNTTVLNDLLRMIGSCSTTAEATGEVTYYSAKSFGAYDPTGNAQSSWDTNSKGNAQILVKLFETTNNSTNTDLNEFTSQYWQAVYRSKKGENDVLTLYMVRSYLSSQTFGSSGNYSVSAVRDVILADYTTLKGKFSQVDKYIVAPYQLSSSNGAEFSTTGYDKSGKNDEFGTKTDFLNLGGWQSSAYQTSQSARNLETTPSINGQWLSSTDENITIKLGASGYCNGGDTSWGYQYGVNNGLDGLGDGWKSWSSIGTNYDDKLWLPSGFEVLHTGYGEEATSLLQDTGRLYDEANDIIYLDSGYSEATAGLNSGASTRTHANSKRTGLWELNGYDRATGSWTWLRSGYSRGNASARAIYLDGNYGSRGVDGSYGVRVALHLNLGGLKSLIDWSSDSALRIDSNGGELANGVSSSATGEENETYSLPTASQLTKTGYTLNGYTLSGGGSLNGFTYTFGSTDGTVTAQWTAITYTIAYTLNGGVLANKRDEYTIESDTYTLPTPTKTGYTFLGWTGSNGSSAQTTVTITKGTIGDKSYTANWESNYAEISLDVTINSNGRQYIIYILDENDNLKEQIMISKNGNSKIEIEKNKKFTILIYESLYMSATIDGETTRKKIYTNGASGAKTITITISSASGQVNNWVIV